jgi:hypothetical protein
MRNQYSYLDPDHAYTDPQTGVLYNKGNIKDQQELTFAETEKAFDEHTILFGAEQQKSLHIKSVDGLFSNLGLLLSDQCPFTIKAAVFEGLEKVIFKDRREFDGSLLKQLTSAYEFLDMFNHICLTTFMQLSKVFIARTCEITPRTLYVRHC